MCFSNILFSHDAQQNYLQIEYLFTPVALFFVELFKFFFTFFLDPDFWMRIHRDKVQDISYQITQSSNLNFFYEKLIFLGNAKYVR